MTADGVGRDLLAGLDFGGPGLREVESRSTPIDDVVGTGTYAAAFYPSGRLCQFAYHALRGRYLLYLEPAGEAGFVWLGTEEADYRDGALTVSAPGFSEGEPARRPWPFRDWAAAAVRDIHRRGQGVTDDVPFWRRPA